MTKEEMLNFLDQYYPVPELKTWKPSDWEMEYYYGTPRKLKKLSKDTDKHNEKLKSEYEAKLQCRNDVINIINDIDNLPDRLKDLFYCTIKNQVLHDIQIRQNLKKYEDEFYGKYKKSENSFRGSAYNICNYASYIIRDCKHIWNETTNTYIVRLPEEKRKYYNQVIDNFENINLDEFYSDAKKYLDLLENAKQTLSPVDCIKFYSEKFKSIIKSIRDTIGGDPEDCTYDSNWGHGNEFNGIVTRGDKKASYKSFLAGGWNIQRLHVRFKITLLKN